jgi:hypothetical protein
MLFPYPFLAKEVSDLDRSVAISDSGVDRKVSVHKSHLVAVPLGDASNQVLHVRDGRAYRSHGAARAKPRINLEMSWKSRFRCLKLRVSLPRGPSTVTILASTFTVTSSGMSMVSEARIVFIVTFRWEYLSLETWGR